VGALGAAFAFVHHALEERAEDARRDAAPVELAALQERGPVLGAEFGDVELLAEEAAVDVGECGEFGVEIDGPFVAVAIKGLKELGEAGAEVGAIAPGSLDETREGVPLENVGIFGEEAEEHADEEAFEIVA